MKSKLVIALIEAHCTNDEAVFKKALLNLAEDEERKGNFSLSNLLKNAYNTNGIKKSTISPSKSVVNQANYSSQSIISTPRDKDSALELVDIYYPTQRLSDVALSEKINDNLNQIIDEQRNSTVFLERGIAPTNRLLLCGPPGCGKTLTANALAGELEIPLVYVKLDGLVSSYLGQTGTNIRKVFDYVKDKHVVLFLDEFDAIAKKRDDSQELGELKRVVNTLLQNMDAMPSNVFLIAATNHHHLLDPAIWRRFDMSVLLELPNDNQRESILSKYISKVLYDYKLDLKILVTLTKGMSGSQIINFMNSLTKKIIVKKYEKEITTQEIAEVWLDHSTLFMNEDSNDFLSALYNLSQNGVSMRMLEEITGIPKSTLSYKFNRGILNERK